ncbi:MAG: sel1 repeat family protein [Deltaproteobacteria bacterium]|nr:sel1 repeat family protein [Deltaproteobacteria bacterium]
MLRRIFYIAALALSGFLGSVSGALAQAGTPEGEEGSREIPQSEAQTTWAYCFSTDTRQCSVAGGHFLQGTGGTSRAPSRAQLAWQHGCEHDDGESCRELGLLHDQGRVVAQHSDRAYQLFAQGCQFGSMASCHEQARMLRLGRGAPENLTEATRLDLWACDHGSAPACRQMATAHSTGHGVPESAEESRRFLAKACELGDRVACGEAAPAQPANVPPTPNGYQPAAADGPVVHPQTIQTALATVMPQLTRCYDRRSRQVPLSGTVQIAFRVDPRGRPAALSVDERASTITDAWMRRCIQNAAQGMVFQPPPPAVSAPIHRSFSFNQ